MKFTNYQNHYPKRAFSRFVFMSGNPEKAEGESLLLPSNPLSFGYSDIASLKRGLSERSSKNLSSEEQKNFHQVVNVQIKKVERETSDSASSRALFAIFRDGQLSRFLTATQRRSIEKLLSNERKAIINISKTSPEHWTQDQAIRVARTYRSVRNKVDTQSLVIDEKSRDVGDKLKIYGAILSRKSSLTAKEKLFVLELNRLFPKASDWSDGEVAKRLKLQSDMVRSELLTDIQSKKDIPFTAKKYWDLLVDEVDGGDSLPALKDFLKRNQAADTVSQLTHRFESENGRFLTSDECRFLLNLASDTDIETGYKFSENDGEYSNEKALEKAKKDLEDSEKLRAKEETEISAIPDRELPSRMKDDFPRKKNVEENMEWFSDDYKEEKENADRKNLMLEVRESLYSTQARDEVIAAKKEHLYELKSKLEAEESIVKKEKEAFTKVEKRAWEILETYKVSLKERVSRGEAVSSDVSVLLDLSNDEIQLLGGEEFLQKKDIVLGVRKEITEKLGEALNINLESSSFSDDQIQSLNENLNYAKVLPLLKDSEVAGLDSMGMFERRQVIEGLIQDIRSKVLNQLVKDEKVSGTPAIDDFVNQYHREHHRINDNDSVEASLNNISKIEGEKRKNKEKYEHAYEKVQSLFSEGDRDLIIVDLNKILKSGVSGEAVMTEIESKLLTEKKLFEYSASEAKAFQKMMVNMLSGKVKSDYSEASILEITAKGLFEKLAQGDGKKISEAGMKQSLKNFDTTTDEYRWMTLEDRYYLSQVTFPISRQVTKETKNFKESHMDQLQAVLGKNAPKLEIDQSVTNLKLAYERELKPSLTNAYKELESELLNYFDAMPDGAKKYLEEIKAQYRDLDQRLSSLFKSKDDLSKFDSGFAALDKDLSNIQALFDFNGGIIGESSKENFDSTITDSAEIQGFVKDELELFGSEGVEKARKNFEKKRQECQEIVDEYAAALVPVEKLMERDLKNFNENDFKLRHQISKSEARKRLQNMRLNNEDITSLMQTFNGENPGWFQSGKAGTFDTWLEWYKDPMKHGNALKFMNSFKTFREELDSEKFPGMSKEMRKWKKEYKENMPLIPFMKNTYSLTLEWYSLKSIYMTIKYAWEKSARKRERRNEEMMAKLGEKMFGDSILGREFKREANEKENERVEEWKKSYADYDASKLKKVIEGVTHKKNRDEARAAIELLVEKGELSIDSPVFLNALNRLYCRTVFTQSDIEGYAQDKDALVRKVGEIYTDIWDRPTWIKTKEEFASKYEAAMKQNEGDIKQEVHTGGVDSYLIRSLDNWAKGTPDDDFEAPRFEQYLKGAIENGVMNGYPGGGDRRLFYMIKAATTKNPNTGETLLGLRSISRFADLVNNIPYLDGLDDSTTWKKDGKVVPEGTPGAEKRSWSYDDIQKWGDYFKHIDVGSMSYSDIKSGSGSAPDLNKAVRKWFNEVLVPTWDAQDRITKVPIDKIDHDDAGNLPLLIPPESMKNIFSYNSGEVRPVSEKFQAGFIKSFDGNYEDTCNYLRMLSENYKDAPGYKEFMTEQLDRFGQMLRVYFMSSHQMAGNWDFESGQGAMFLSDKEWNRDGKEVGKAYDSIQKTISELAVNPKIKNELVDQRFEVSKVKEARDRDKVGPNHLKVIELIEETYGNNSIFQNYAQLAAMAGISL